MPDRHIMTPCTCSLVSFPHLRGLKLPQPQPASTVRVVDVLLAYVSFSIAAGILWKTSLCLPHPNRPDNDDHLGAELPNKASHCPFGCPPTMTILYRRPSFHVNVPRSGMSAQLLVFVNSQTPEVPRVSKGQEKQVQSSRWDILVYGARIFVVNFFQNQHPTSPRTTAIGSYIQISVLKTELKHLDVPEIIRRPRESEVRVTCGKSFSFVIQ